MLPAAEKLASHLQSTNLNTPEIQLVHNVDVTSHADPAAIREALKQQLYQPVRWVDSVKFMAEQGVTRFVECGPGKVLIGLNKRIVKEAEHFTFYDNETLNNVMEQLND